MLDRAVADGGVGVRGGDRVGYRVGGRVGQPGRGNVVAKSARRVKKGEKLRRRVSFDGVLMDIP